MVGEPSTDLPPSYPTHNKHQNIFTHTAPTYYKIYHPRPRYRVVKRAGRPDLDADDGEGEGAAGEGGDEAAAVEPGPRRRP